MIIYIVFVSLPFFILLTWTINNKYWTLCRLARRWRLANLIIFHLWYKERSSKEDYDVRWRGSELFLLPVLTTTVNHWYIDQCRELWDLTSCLRRELFLFIFFYVNRYLQAKNLLEIIVLYNFVLFVMLGVCKNWNWSLKLCINKGHVFTAISL